VTPQSKFQFELASWFYENKNYALTYTVLVEALVTKQCENNKMDSKVKENREMAKDILWKGNFASYKEIVGIRNDIAHQRDSKHADTKKNVSDLKDYLAKAKSSDLMNKLQNR